MFSSCFDLIVVSDVKTSFHLHYSLADFSVRPLSSLIDFIFSDKISEALTAELPTYARPIFIRYRVFLDWFYNLNINMDEPATNNVDL